MSRTWKDRPRRIRLGENMRKGLIEHHHLPAYPYYHRRWRTAWDLSCTFLKKDTVAINAYRAELDEMESVRYELVEHPPKRYWRDSLVDDEGDLIELGYYYWTEREIEFKVERYWEYEIVEPHCTSPEDYDAGTGLDRATGRPADCVPDVTYEFWGAYSRRFRSRFLRSKVNDTLSEAVRLANAGELDEDYWEEALYYEKDRRYWDWD